MMSRPSSTVHTRGFMSRHMARRTLALGCALFALAGALAPRPAAAGATLSLSLGYGHELQPKFSEQATNIMLTPGYSFLLDILRVEVGFLGAYGALRGGVKDDFNLELRPMLRASIPLVPVYGRVILAGLSPFSDKRALAYGGALGGALSLFGVGVFGEIGVLPRHLQDGFHWILEGRAGASYAF
jgi:hypothetical protein